MRTLAIVLSLLALNQLLVVNPVSAARAISIPESQIWSYTVKETRKPAFQKYKPQLQHISLPKNTNATKKKAIAPQLSRPTSMELAEPSARAKIILEKLEAPLKTNQLELALRILEYETRQNPGDQDLVVAKARILDALNRTDQSVVTLLNFLKNFPGRLRATACLGDLYFLTGDFASARRSLKIFENTNSNDGLSYYRIAQLALLDDDKVRALQFVNRALEVDQHLFEAQLMQARLLAAKGDLSGASKAYARSLELESDSSLTIAEWASLLASSGKTLDAIEKLLQAHRLDPTSVEIVQRFICIYGMRQDWPNALDYAKSWVKFEPKNAEAYFVAGFCALNIGEYIEASSFFKDSLKLDPENPATHNLYAMAQYEQRKIEDAIYEFKQAELLARQKALAQQEEIAAMNLVLVYASKSRFEEAYKKLDQIELEKQEKTETVQALRSYVLALQGKYAQARQLAKSLWQVGKQEPVFSVLALSLCEISEGEPQIAIVRLKPLSRTLPLSSYIFYLLSAAYLAAGNVEEALEQAEQSLQIAPSNLQTKAMLARALIKKKNYSGSIPLLKECIARNSKDLNLRLDLADAQILNGDSELAELTYEKAQKAFPESAEPLIGLSKIALSGKQFRQAESFAKEAVLIQPSNEWARLLLAKSMYAQRKVSETIDELNSFGALKYLSDSDLVKREALLLRANALLLKGENESSLDAFESAESLHIKMNNDDRLAFALAAERSNRRDLALKILSQLRSTSLLSRSQSIDLTRLENRIKRVRSK